MELDDRFVAIPQLVEQANPARAQLPLDALPPFVAQRDAGGNQYAECQSSQREAEGAGHGHVYGDRSESEDEAVRPDVARFHRVQLTRLMGDWFVTMGVGWLMVQNVFCARRGIKGRLKY